MPRTEQKVDVAIVMPLGPHDHPTDTIASIQKYISKARAVIVVDDSKNTETRQKLQTLGSDIHVLEAGDYPGGWGGLFVKLSQGYRYAYEHFDFKVLLRLDADALIIGAGAEKEAIEYFSAHPDIGLIGSYKVDSNGDPRNIDAPAKHLRRESGRITGQRHPQIAHTLRSAIRLANVQDYKYGEHCLGGAYFHSAACVEQLYKNGWLGKPEMTSSKLGEDQIFALFTKAVGFGIGDFVTGDYPLALRWKGLPNSPEELVKRGKKITHSVRFWEDMKEDEIRAFFASRRERE